MGAPGSLLTRHSYCPQSQRKGWMERNKRERRKRNGRWGKAETEREREGVWGRERESDPLLSWHHGWSTWDWSRTLTITHWGLCSGRGVGGCCQGVACFVSPKGTHMQGCKNSHNARARPCVSRMHTDTWTHRHAVRRGLTLSDRRMWAAINRPHGSFSLTPPLRPWKWYGVSEALISIHWLSPAHLFGSLMPVRWRGSWKWAAE